MFKGKCKYCSYEFNCKMKPTSNFSKHAQTHDQLFIEYLKAKENQTKRKNHALNQSNMSFSVNFPTNLNYNTPVKNTTLTDKYNPMHSNSTFLEDDQTPSAMIPKTQHRLSNSPLSQSRLERAVTKYVVNSLSNAQIVETKYFNDFILDITGHDEFQKISKTKIVNKLIPQYYENIDKKLRDLINLSINSCMDSYFTIQIDLFSDANESVFAGYTLHAITSNWETINQNLGAILLNQNSNPMDLTTKYFELCQRYHLSNAKVFKLVFDEKTLQMNNWNTFRNWSLPGMNLLDDSFFDINLESSLNETSCSNDKETDGIEFISNLNHVRLFLIRLIK